MLKLLSSVLWSASMLASVQSAPLKKLAVLKSSVETPVMISVEYCDWTVTESDSTSEQLWSGHTRCYCVSQSGIDYGCEIPAPVIQFEAGTTAVIDVTNRMSGMTMQEIEDAGIEINQYRAVDVTNLHTHGLHVSPDEDDVLISIDPNGGNHRYLYTIPDDHYFGSHWYHAHQHGSTAIQVTGGMFGAIDMIGPQSHSESHMLNKYEQSWIIMHYFFAVSSSDCGDCSDNSYEQWTSLNGVDGFDAESTCFMWCSLDIRERQASGLAYDFESLSNKEYFLVNGQLTPTLTIQSDSYHWLRMVNAMPMYFAQLRFPRECQVYLAGNDGIWFDEYRDLSQYPFDYASVIPAGGRADVMIKCQHNSNDPRKRMIHKVYFDRNVTVSVIDNNDLPPDGTVAFYIQVEKENSIANDTSRLPLIPRKPSYLDDLRDGSKVMNDPNTDFVTDCPCRHYNYTQLGDECGVMFDLSGEQGTINGREFDPSQPLWFVKYGSVYEYLISNGAHPLHQHVNAFQVQSDLQQGFEAYSGDWRDTVAGNHDSRVRMRFEDFLGSAITHCHFLAHEDHGMMAYYEIVNASELQSYYKEYPILMHCGL